MKLLKPKFKIGQILYSPQYWVPSTGHIAKYYICEITAYYRKEESFICYYYKEIYDNGEESSVTGSFRDSYDLFFFTSKKQAEKQLNKMKKKGKHE